MSQAENCIVEYIVCGGLLKVSVVEPTSGIEAVVWGPQHQSKEALLQLALRKLDYLRRRAAADAS